MLNSYRGKTVLVTGHTGFKGTWLVMWLTSLGAKVVGLSDDLPSEPSNFVASHIAALIDDRRVDVRDFGAVKQVIDEVQPDFVFHLAAQALVRRSYAAPLETFEVNGMGTAHVLEALRALDKPVAAVMITSDKVYDNVEWVWGYRETDRIGGKDPYSGSKGVAELVIRSYLASYFGPQSKVRIGVARAGNVIGGGDWAADRIVPDCMRAWSRGDSVDIRNPNSTRPWQHVLEPLSGYLLLGAELAARPERHGEAYNFGPHAHQNQTVGELIDGMRQFWSNVSWNDVSSNQHLHEAGLLKLNCDKAFHDLQWLPALNFMETVRLTVEWYRAFYEQKPESMLEVSRAQIAEYVRIAGERGVAWTRS